MATYEVKDDAGKVYDIDAKDPESAMRRIADLYQVTVIAWREPRYCIHVGIPYGS